MTRLLHLRWFACFLAAVCAGLLMLGQPQLARALQPPDDAMLARMRANGTLAAAQERAKALGTYEPRLPSRGARQPELPPQQTADGIMAHYGWALDAQGKAVSKLTSRELSPVELDLNHDRQVDERDVLALGFARPKSAAALQSLGTVNVLCLYIDFSDYPAYYTTAELDKRLFDQGDTQDGYRSLQYFYDQSSYGDLHIEGTVYQHRASHPRSYYHPDDNNTYAHEGERRTELLTEAITALDASGHDFSQYDNDGDGIVDYYMVIWTGPHGDWLTYWWALTYYTYAVNLTVDGVSFLSSTLSWQWERKYGFVEPPPTPGYYSPFTVIHETGHALGLPDYYDYDDTIGPDGGVGGLDMMHWVGDHGCFSKYVLGWLAPTVAFTNLSDEPLDKAYDHADAVVCMPGFDPVTPWSEYFMAQYRTQDDVDFDTWSSGMLLWHVDSRVTRDGNFLYNNSYTTHKLLRLMEADGQESIENTTHWADAGDYYQTGNTFSHTSFPNSDKYDNSNSNVTVSDFSAPGAQMTADFTLYTSNPPQVTITAPAAGSTVSGNAVGVSVQASDDHSISKVQLLIDGQVVQTWTSWTSSGTYTWNTLVEYNKTLAITARAWDGEQQAGSATISVTVSNSGLGAFSDDFNTGLDQWRVVNYPEIKKGTFTEWTLRTSPASPPPLGTGNEACVSAPANALQYYCYDMLRSQRVNGTAFTHPVRLRCYYRCWTDSKLMYSIDNGASWQLLELLPSSANWLSLDRYYPQLSGHMFYLGLFYDGAAQSDYSSACTFNIDNVSVQQLPSDPPQITITSPADGATVAGDLVVNANATDDIGVAQVRFYLNGALVSTDTSAPWQYVRDTRSDDNHPALPLYAVAVDGDGLTGQTPLMHLVLHNAFIYPVYENLESNFNWSTANNAPPPDWVWASGVAYSGIRSYAWAQGPGAGATSDLLWFNGHADLGAAGVQSPQLRLMHTGDLPTGASVGIYFINSWTGDHWLGTISQDQAAWTDYAVDLGAYLGYSGRLKFTAMASNVSGTGFWLDDLRVENAMPTITAITPARGLTGATVHIDGMTFGFTRDAGSYVTFGGGVQAAESDYISWSNNQVSVKIPVGAVSGDTTVTVAGQSSNAVRVAVLLAPPALEDLDQR